MSSIDIDGQLKNIGLENKPLDYYYGPYESTIQACVVIPADYIDEDSGETVKTRYLGLTVGIIVPNSNTIVEYWWKNGTTDSDLIVKQTGGGGESVTIVDEITDTQQTGVAVSPKAVTDYVADYVEKYTTIRLQQI